MSVKPVKKKKVDKTTPSTICRVNKKNNFTVLSNQLLRSPNLSLKAIGLMSKVLSLPKEWDYSIAGLTAICIEKESAIKSALAELRKWGYLKVTKLMPNQTNSGRIEYVYDFYEYSEIDVPQEYGAENQIVNDSNVVTSSEVKAFQADKKQDITILPLKKQAVEFQSTEKHGQLNTKNKTKKNQILSNQVSINQSASDSESAVENQTDILIDGYISENEVYADVVRTNIDFLFFAEWLGDKEEAEEIVQMIVRQICSRKKTERMSFSPRRRA